MADEGMSSGQLLAATNNMGAGTGEGGKGALLGGFIPHVGMQGSVFSAFLGSAPSLMKGITGTDPAEVKVAAPTPGAALGTDKFIGKGGGGQAL